MGPPACVCSVLQAQGSADECVPGPGSRVGEWPDEEGDAFWGGHGGVGRVGLGGGRGCGIGEAGRSVCGKWILELEHTGVGVEAGCGWGEGAGCYASVINGRIDFSENCCNLCSTQAIPLIIPKPGMNRENRRKPRLQVSIRASTK